MGGACGERYRCKLCECGGGTVNVTAAFVLPLKANIMENFCISVDWLQTFCLGSSITEGEYASPSYLFKVKKQDQETQLFKSVYSVKIGSIEVATILQDPRTEVINKRATCVKLSNRVLYSMRYIEMLYDLQAALHLQYKGITRLDICYDCNALHDGRNVERFIRDYVTHEPFTKGHIIRRGSCAFTLHGSRKATSVARFQSIRFGSPKCRIGAYCYNKTQELIEVKDKPWIRQMWKENGLEYYIDEHRLNQLTPQQKEKEIQENTLSDYVKKSVWRFEISIKSEGMDILNISTAELFHLSPRYLEHADRIRELFFIYAAKVFDFRINTGQKLTRHYPKLQIFEQQQQVTCKPYYFSRAADTGRMEKICYNKLVKLSEEYTDLSEPRRIGLQNALEFLLELHGIKSQKLAAERYTTYLKSLKGKRFTAQDTLEYFSVLEKLADTRRQIDTECLYDLFFPDPITAAEVQKILQETPPPDLSSIRNVSLPYTPERSEPNP